MHDPTRGHAVSMQEGLMSKLCGGSMLLYREHGGTAAMLAPLVTAVLVLALIVGPGSTYAAPSSGSLTATSGPIASISASDAHACATLSDGTIKVLGLQPGRRTR